MKRGEPAVYYLQPMMDMSNATNASQPQQTQQVSKKLDVESSRSRLKIRFANLVFSFQVILNCVSPDLEKVCVCMWAKI